MSSVFISHRTSDLLLAERLAKELETAGHKVWIDSNEIRTGDSIVDKIEAGLAGAKYLILCYSRDGVSSPWTSREWQSTLARQLSGVGVTIVPVVLSGGGPVPAILADLKYADFTTNWAAALGDVLIAIR